MAEIFKLPNSSYEEIVKLIQAYASEKEGTLLSLDDISHSTGIARTVVSANNGFFVQIGLITEGNKKSSTEKGRALGRAYNSRIDYEIVRIWQEVIRENDFLNRMISAVRIRNGMDRSNLLSHIVYSSGQKENKGSRTGAGAIIEILKVSELLSETDGKLTINETAELNQSVTLEQPIIPEASHTSGKTPIDSGNSLSTNTRVVINVNINCSPEDIDALGEKLKELIKQL